MDEAAVCDERLLCTYTKKSETAEAEASGLFADEVIIVSAVAHPHGVQPVVHASAEFDIARASSDSFRLEVEKDHPGNGTVREADHVGSARSTALQEQLYVPALPLPNRFGCCAVRECCHRKPRMHYSNALLFIRHHPVGSICSCAFGLGDALSASYMNTVVQDEIVNLSHWVALSRKQPKHVVHRRKKQDRTLVPQAIRELFDSVI